MHTIPTLVDNGVALWESRAIIIYLVEKYGQADTSLYPTDALQRAVVNQRLFFDLGTLYQRFADYFYPQLYYQTPAEEMKFKKMLEAMEFLNIFLEGQKWVAATENMSVADIVVAVTVTAFEGAEVDISAYGNVTKWYAEMKKTAVGWSTAEKNMEQFKKYFEVLKK